MDIRDQIRITEELLEGVKELNGEYQEGWENNILDAENLLKHLKQVKNNDLLHDVSQQSELLIDFYSKQNGGMNETNKNAIIREVDNYIESINCG